MYLKKLLLITSLIAFFYTIALAQQDMAAGESLFKTRCISCHAIGKKMIGPDLKGVTERHHPEWIIKFVQSSQSMVKAGDKDAITVFEANNKIMMPDHPDLKANDIENILAYIQDKSAAPKEAKPASLVPDEYTPYGKETSLWHQIIYLDFEDGHTPVTAKDYGFWAALCLAVIFILFILIISVKINDFTDLYLTLQQKQRKEQDSSDTKQVD